MIRRTCPFATNEEASHLCKRVAYLRKMYSFYRNAHFPISFGFACNVYFRCTSFGIDVVWTVAFALTYKVVGFFNFVEIVQIEKWVNSM